jgi:hypothetical protein
MLLNSHTPGQCHQYDDDSCALLRCAVLCLCCSWSHSRADSEHFADISKQFTEEAIDFQRKVSSEGLAARVQQHGFSSHKLAARVQQPGFAARVQQP